MVELKIIRPDIQSIVMKTQDRVVEIALGHFRVRAVQQQLIAVAGEELAPQRFLLPHD